MIRKLYKYKKLVICVMFILGVAFYFTAKYFTGNHDVAEVQHTYTGLSYIRSSQVIDKDQVIKSLSNDQQLVGLEGTSSKSYTYVDSLFKHSGWLKDWIGERTVTLDAIAHFKMGINLNDIKPEDIKVYGNSLFIQIPKQVLISLDVPYDQLVFKTKTGIMRSEMSEAEKQQMYTEIRRLFEDNIMSDQNIITQSEAGIESALRLLLEKIPNVNRVVFKSI